MQTHYYTVQNPPHIDAHAVYETARLKDEYEAKAERLQKEVDTLRTQIQQSGSDARESVGLRRELDDRLKDIETLHAKHVRSNLEHQENNRRLTTNLERLKSDAAKHASEMQSKGARIKELETKLEKFGGTWKKKQELVADLHTEINQLNGKHEARILELNRDIEQHKQKGEKTAQLEIDLAREKEKYKRDSEEAHKIIETLKQKHAELRTDNESLRAGAKRLSEYTHQLHQSLGSHPLHSHHAQWKKKLEKHSESLASHNVDKGNIDTLLKELDAIKPAVESFKLKLNDLKMSWFKIFFSSHNQKVEDFKKHVDSFLNHFQKIQSVVTKHSETIDKYHKHVREHATALSDHMQKADEDMVRWKSGLNVKQHPEIQGAHLPLTE